MGLRRISTTFIAFSLALGLVSLAPAAQADDALSRFYDQELTWAKCSGGMQCAWLTVPLDYADPGGETIRIRLSRKASTGSSRLGSLVVNPGGPGGSGLGLASWLAGAMDKSVTSAYSIVGFDPRGVGMSAPITCLTGKQNTEMIQADGAPETLAEEERIMQLARRLADGCLSRNPSLAEHVGTADTVRDLDIMRAALGDDKLNWLGYSYGTELGARYAEAFPERVGRMILDGAVDPSLDSMELSKGQSAGFLDALDRFAKDCSRRESCPYKGGSSDVLAGISALLTRLDKATLPGTYGPMGESEALNALIYAMYSPQSWPYLRRGLAQAERGNGRGLAAIADAATDRTGKNSYAGNMSSAFTAISCWDAPPVPGIDGLRRAAREWSRNTSVPQIAQALAWSNAACSQWFGHATKVSRPVTSSTSAPILIIGTTHDPATPYAWAQALERQLPTSRLLTYIGDGHTAYLTGSACLDKAANDYLVTGALPPPGKRCR